MDEKLPLYPMEHYEKRLDMATNHFTEPIGSVYIKDRLRILTEANAFCFFKQPNSQYHYTLQHVRDSKEWVVKDYLWDAFVGEIYHGPDLHDAALTLMNILGPEYIRPLTKITFNGVPEDVIKQHERIVGNYLQQVEE